MLGVHRLKLGSSVRPESHADPVAWRNTKMIKHRLAQGDLSLGSHCKFNAQVRLL
jgi:hypothetical protein